MVVKVIQRRAGVTPQTRRELLARIRDEGLHLHLSRYGAALGWTVAINATALCGTDRCVKVGCGP